MWSNRHDGANHNVANGGCRQRDAKRDLLPGAPGRTEEERADEHQPASVAGRRLLKCSRDGAAQQNGTKPREQHPESQSNQRRLTGGPMKIIAPSPEPCAQRPSTIQWKAWNQIEEAQ